MNSVDLLPIGSQSHLMDRYYDLPPIVQLTGHIFRSQVDLEALLTESLVGFLDLVSLQREYQLGIDIVGVEDGDVLIPDLNPKVCFGQTLIGIGLIRNELIGCPETGGTRVVRLDAWFEQRGWVGGQCVVGVRLMRVGMGDHAAAPKGGEPDQSSGEDRSPGLFTTGWRDTQNGLSARERQAR